MKKPKNDNPKPARKTAQVPLSLLRDITRFMDSVYSGRFSDLPMKTLGCFNCGNQDGLKSAIAIERNLQQDARALGDTVEEYLPEYHEVPE